MIMSVDNSIYLQLKSNITKDLGQTLYLKDVANISCTPDIKTQLEKLVVLPKEERGFVVITVVDIIEIIRLAMPGIPVSSIGEIKVYIEPDTKKDFPGIDLMTFVKVVITCIFTFIGSGLAIMYFHADVNMHEVHRNIVLAITGETNPNPYWINIPYSIGLGIGIAVFFGIFPSKNKPKTPDPLKIGMLQYKQDINSYLESKDEREQEGK